MAHLYNEETISQAIDTKWAGKTVHFAKETDSTNVWIKKLEKDGVIAGYHAMVDPMKLGYHILAFINLDVIPEDKPKFYAFAESVPNVLECSCVTGEYSMLMKVAFHSTMELDIFIGQLQKFGKTSTQIVFSTHVGPRGVDVDEV